MITEKDDIMSVRKQCALLNVQRSSLYYERRGENAYNLELMNMIDEEYTRHPNMGVPSMTEYLRDLGKKCGPKRVRRLMRVMGLEAIYPKPNTSRPNKQHKIYPYLLRDIVIERANQVWSPLELLIGFLKNPKIDIRPVLDVISKEFIPLRDKIEWGYIIPYPITGILNEPLRAAMSLRKSEQREDCREFFESLIIPEIE